MAYEIGTADNYTDLLDRLIDFLSNPNRVADSGSDITELVAIDDTVQSGEPWTRYTSGLTLIPAWVMTTITGGWPG